MESHPWKFVENRMSKFSENIFKYFYLKKKEIFAYLQSIALKPRKAPKNPSLW